MKKQLIWVFEWRKSVHYCWSYILFSPECKELTSMLDPLLYRWGVPPVVIRCVHCTMQMGVLQTWIKAQGIAIVMQGDNTTDPGWGVLPACQWLVLYRDCKCGWRYPEKSAPRRSRPRRSRPHGELGPRRTGPHQLENSAPSAGELDPSAGELGPTV